MKATLFHTNGIRSEITLSSFSHAQELVGGLIQIIYLSSQLGLLCNEEGRFLNLDANPFFTEYQGNLILVNLKDFNNLPFYTPNLQ